MATAETGLMRQGLCRASRSHPDSRISTSSTDIVVGALIVIEVLELFFLGPRTAVHGGAIERSESDGKLSRFSFSNSDFHLFNASHHFEEDCLRRVAAKRRKNGLNKDYAYI